MRFGASHTRMALGSGLGLGLAFALVTIGDDAAAATSSGAVGYTYYQGAAHNLTRAVTVEGTLALPGLECSLAALRFDDGLIGQGVQLIAGLGVPVEGVAVLRAQGGSVMGDGDYRGWRLKLGPEINLSRIAAAQVSYLHYEDNQDFHSDGVALESAAVLSPRVTGRLGASYAASSLDINSTQATSGLTWAALPHVELSGEAGVARNGGVAPVGAQRPRSLLDPLLGPQPGAPASAEENDISTIYQLNVRFTFP